MSKFLFYPLSNHHLVPLFQTLFSCGCDNGILQLFKEHLVEKRRHLQLLYQHISQTACDIIYNEQTKVRIEHEK